MASSLLTLMRDGLLAVVAERLDARLPEEADHLAGLGRRRGSRCTSRSASFTAFAAVGVLVPRRGRLGDAGLRQDVLAIEVAHRSDVLRDRPHLLVGRDLVPRPVDVVAREVVRAVRREVEQGLGEHERRDVLVLDLRDIRCTLAGLDRAAQLLVVRQALADVLDLDVDGGVLLLEELDLVLDVGHPRPEGELRWAWSCASSISSCVIGPCVVAAAGARRAAGEEQSDRDGAAHQRQCCSWCLLHD